MRIFDVDMSFDSNKIAFACQGVEIGIYDLQNELLNFYPSTVKTKKNMASISDNNSSNNIMNKLEIQTSVVFSKTDNRLFCSTNKGRIYCLGTINWKKIWEQRLNNTSFLNVSVSSFTNKIAISTFDSSIIILDAITGKDEVILNGHEGRVFKTIFTPDDMHLISISSDSTIRFWDIKTEKEIFVLSLPIRNDPETLPFEDFDFKCFANNEYCLLTVPSTDGKIFVYQFNGMFCN